MAIADTDALPAKKAHLAPGELPIWVRIAAFLVVVLVYALPLLFHDAASGHLLNVAFQDEKIYLVRVAAVYRGESLGNPYLAGHDNAPKYMPEIGERAIAGSAHLLRISPLAAVAGSRIALPCLIFLLMLSIGSALRLSRAAALMAAFTLLLFPSPVSLLTDYAHFLRYFRTISPAFYVLLLLVYLRALLGAVHRPGPARILAAIAALFVLFLTPVYYWGFAVCGTAVLLMLARQSERKTAAIVVLAGSVLASPFVYRQVLLARVPEVRETLARLLLMTPGRIPELSTLVPVLLGTTVAVVAWVMRRDDVRSRFLLAFSVISPLLLCQNVVTNRQMQAQHWMQTLLPICCLVFAWATQSFLCNRRHFFFVAAAILAMALAQQAFVLRYIERSHRADPDFWELGARIPSTLAWLNANTPPGSVVLSSDDVMDSLPIFTHNKVFLASYAAQHVVSEAEMNFRRNAFAAWSADPRAIPSEVDYILARGAQCDIAPSPLFRSPEEQACVFSASTVRAAARPAARRE